MRGNITVISVAVVALAALAAIARADDATAEAHKYSKYDVVAVLANKVGPFANPTETYPYYSLPFCPPDNLQAQEHKFGETLSGDRKVNTPYQVHFLVNEEWRALCDVSLTAEQVNMFAVAADEDYYFELIMDDLPMWGYVGESQHSELMFEHAHRFKHFLYTHLHFDVYYNQDVIIAVNVTTDPTKKVDVSSGTAMNVRFSYSVSWTATDVLFEHRLERLNEHQFLPTTLEIHWLSIINSLVLVLLLTAFLAVILVRVVRNDLTRFLRAGDEESNTEDESGWKQVHADVFRFPARANMFSAVVGAGAQLLLAVAALLTMTLLGVLSQSRRGSLLTGAIVLYTLSAGAGGYIAARLYKQMGGESWVRNIMLTSCMFPLPLFIMFCLLNTVAIAKSSTSALPFGTIVIVLMLFLLVNFPLTVLGGIAGRNSTGPFDAPCRANKAAREIPALPFYKSGFVQVLMAGFLPFSAISIELHYIFAAVWGHRAYTLFGILYLAFALLLVVTAFIVIALTYFQLAAEDHRWWWRSLVSGGSVGFFIFGYCFFYFFSHSAMNGVLQVSFYFGYMFIVSYGFFLMAGFVGFYAALFFVRYIYSRIKVE